MSHASVDLHPQYKGQAATRLFVSVVCVCIYSPITAGVLQVKHLIYLRESWERMG